MFTRPLMYVPNNASSLHTCSHVHTYIRSLIVCNIKVVEVDWHVSNASLIATLCRGNYNNSHQKVHNICNHFSERIRGKCHLRHHVELFLSQHSVGHVRADACLMVRMRYIKFI